MTSPASALEHDAEPRVIAGKYRLECLLGEGGMGSIWRAFNLHLEVPVAIKLLRPGLNSDELGERLRVEARAAAKLVHPSIVRVFDIGEAESGEPFIVMELLNGESLGDALELGPLPAVNAVQMLLPIAEALSLAHSRGVVHRDLKPDNIFLAREGDAVQPKLLDFGIAKVTSTLAAGGAVLTQTGVLLGSPDYMSPEQACGRADIDQRSDIWSFCVVLYEAISGATPFSGTTAQSILRSVVQDDPLPVDMLTQVDRRLSDLIMSGLHKDREQRPPSIFDLGQALATWLHEQGVTDDATGASLEAKWLGRTSDTLVLTHPKSSGAPRAHHEHATLVSVVHPHPHVSSTRPIPLPPERRPRWLGSALVACAVLVASFSWAVVREVQRRTPRGEPVAVVPAPPPAAHAAAQAPPIPVEALAVDPRAPLAEGAGRVDANGAATPANLQLAASIARPQPATQAPASQASLPQALPSRDPAEELLQPY
jgi:eukaryotic-like serine/threonine-protein kinase